MNGRWLGVVAGGVVVSVIAALLVLAVLRAQAPPEGPVEPAWDRVACARCRMLIGDPSFAAQAHGSEGQVLHFDDPGCLLLEIREGPMQPVALWFHHARRDAWIPVEKVAFVRTAPTPMGYGLAAVEAGAPDAIDLEAAIEHVLRVDRERRGEAP